MICYLGHKETDYMKRTIFAVFTLLITAATCAPAFAQDVQSSVQEQSTPAEQTSAPAAVVPAAPQGETAPAAPAAVSAPAAPAAPAAARSQSCPNCFQPLLAGYNEIITDLKSWMDEMGAKAADLDRRLSEIQKRIDEKDDAIEKAKAGTDKKAAKAAVKALNKERKLVLKEYTNANDERDEFYKKFSKEAEKKVESYNAITAAKLQMTLSAASQ